MPPSLCQQKRPPASERGISQAEGGTRVKSSSAVVVWIWNGDNETARCLCWAIRADRQALRDERLSGGLCKHAGRNTRCREEFFIKDHRPADVTVDCIKRKWLSFWFGLFDISVFAVWICCFLSFVPLWFSTLSQSTKIYSMKAVLILSLNSLRK